MTEKELLCHKTNHRIYKTYQNFLEAKIIYECTSELMLN